MEWIRGKFVWVKVSNDKENAIITRKKDAKSVQRNKLRRRVKHIMRNTDEFQGRQVILVLKDAYLVKYELLKDDYEKVFNTIMNEHFSDCGGLLGNFSVA